MRKRNAQRVHSHGSHLTDLHRVDGPVSVESDSLTSMCRDLGSCVYFIRCDDGAIKIGTTTNLARRKRAFGSGWQHILAVLPGDASDEQALHEQFAENLRRGREYFDPSPALMAHINSIRARLGVDPVAA